MVARGTQQDVRTGADRVPVIDPHGRWRLHEIALVVLGFLMPLGVTAVPSVLGDDRLTVLVAIAASFLLVMSAIWLSQDHARTIGPAVRSAIVPVVLYVLTLGVVTALHFDQLPIARVVLFGFAPVAVLGFVVAEAYRRGAWVDIAYRIAVLHTAHAVWSGQAIDTGHHLQRAMVSHVLIGWEASLALIFALLLIKDVSGWRRAVRWGIIALSSVVVVLAGSRAAWAAVILALVYWMWRHPARYRGARNFFLIVALAFVGFLAWEMIFDAFARGNAEGLLGGTGRWDIWQAVFAANDSWGGYGFAALRDGEGPDAALHAATEGRPAENALLNAFLMGGVVGALLWLWIALRAARASWRTRVVAHGVSVAIAIQVFMNAMFSGGISGGSQSWWWLLALFSLADAVAARDAPDGSLSVDPDAKGLA